MSTFLPSLLLVMMGGVLLGMGFIARKKQKPLKVGRWLRG